MTLNELFTYCSNQLSFGDCGNFETQCIFEDVLNIKKEKLYCNDMLASENEIQIIDNIIKRRKAGEPLQYILGNWDFYDLTFSVGKGVLIPRPETELLVDFALTNLKGVVNPVVYDLCAGTGCIGLTIAKHLPNAKVFLLEKEQEAFDYLNKNAQNCKLDNVKLLNDDLFTIDLDELPMADIIISNPPYIPSSEICDLQKEVLYEPISALDGGTDGLDFYRCLASKWVSNVKENGLMAFECGDGQTQDIINIFDGLYKDKNIIFDFNNIDRIVTFRI
ncbi:MAG: peptide chain release factor N(5)-glutamine methyltransferase [Clostridia bacterium]|nr:peptide chain release factor N(5)-glutamine methyltransferase [Clostridia bacterium]